MAAPRVTAAFEAIAATAPGQAETLARLDALATVMDSAVVIPGTRFRVGLDAVIGLVPGIGDLVSAVISSYIIWEARRLGLPRWKIARMIANVAADTAVGAIPFLGDAFDAVFKSNRRNIRILRDHFGPDAGIGRESRPKVIDADYTVVRR